MLNIIWSQKNGAWWAFHWDGTTMTPFSDDEMEVERRVARETLERAGAAAIQKAFDAMVIAKPVED